MDFDNSFIEQQNTSSTSVAALDIAYKYAHDGSTVTVAQQTYTSDVWGVLLEIG